MEPTQMFTEWKIKRHLIAGGDYSKAANCHVKSPVMFLVIFKIFSDISEFLCIYSTSSHGTPNDSAESW
jgi:mRNA-degrading endonuclease YafQ of YafQ-DinJ toxin-antitoxin module